MVKNLSANAGDTRDVGLIPGSRRSSGEGNGNSLHYSCLEYPRHRGALWAAVHGVTKESVMTEQPNNNDNKNNNRELYDATCLPQNACVPHSRIFCTIEIIVPNISGVHVYLQKSHFLVSVPEIVCFPEWFSLIVWTL